MREGEAEGEEVEGEPIEAVAADVVEEEVGERAAVGETGCVTARNAADKAEDAVLCSPATPPFIEPPLTPGGEEGNRMGDENDRRASSW